jgi:AGAP008943-PA (fragment)
MVGHIGHYTCFAKDHKGNTASATAYLNVEYPAQVTNYKKTVHLILGQSGLITCDTIANPPLLDTKWSFGNLSFEDLRDTHIRKHGTDSLLFDKVSRKHSGSYYCLPINLRTDLVFPVDNVAQEIELIVDDPLYFTSTLPMTMSVNYGDTIKLICSGNGYPTPKMVWKKLNKSKWMPVTDSQIKFNSIQDGGLYKCVLYNKHQSIEHITRVIVKY